LEAKLLSQSELNAHSWTEKPFLPSFYGISTIYAFGFSSSGQVMGFDWYSDR